MASSRSVWTAASLGCGFNQGGSGGEDSGKGRWRKKERKWLMVEDERRGRWRKRQMKWLKEKNITWSRMDKGEPKRK